MRIAILAVLLQDARLVGAGQAEQRQLSHYTCPTAAGTTCVNTEAELRTAIAGTATTIIVHPGTYKFTSYACTPTSPADDVCGVHQTQGSGTRSALCITRALTIEAGSGPGTVIFTMPTPAEDSALHDKRVLYINPGTGNQVTISNIEITGGGLQSGDTASSSGSCAYGCGICVSSGRFEGIGLTFTGNVAGQFLVARWQSMRAST